MSLTRANMPLEAIARFGTSIFHSAVRVESEHRRHAAADDARKLLAGERVHFISATTPPLTRLKVLLDEVGDQPHSPVRMSQTETIGRVRACEAPWFQVAGGREAVHGGHDVGVRGSNLQFGRAGPASDPSCGLPSSTAATGVFCAPPPNLQSFSAFEGPARAGTSPLQRVLRNCRSVSRG